MNNFSNNSKERYFFIIFKTSDQLSFGKSLIVAPMVKRILLLSLFILISFLFLNFGKATAQTNDPLESSFPTIMESDSNRLFFRFDNLNFIKNNEYFSDYARGYTTLGFILTPLLDYHPGPHSKISAGAHMLKYSGRSTFHKTAPVFSFQYAFTPHLDLIVGSLSNPLNHRLPEPIFDFERYFLEQNETGLQLIYQQKKIYADFWIAWEQFVLENEPFQEKFNIGLTTEIELLKKERLSLGLPANFLFRHQGGQINDSDDPLVSIFNGAWGLDFKVQFPAKPRIKNISIKSQFFKYEDLSVTREQAYKDGHAFYTMFQVAFKRSTIMTGYWDAHEFIAPIGHPLYQSVSSSKPYIEGRDRHLWNTKLIFHQPLSKDIRIGLRTELFYDLDVGKFDYAYAFFLSFRRDYQLKRIQD